MQRPKPMEIQYSNFAYGDKVIVKEKYVLEIGKKDLELAKFLAYEVGEVVEFDDITWEYKIQFRDRSLWFRRFHLDCVELKRPNKRNKE